ncbi:MAG: glycosyltransferase family 2 protein [Sporomusaceae bacterium]|nr:glycosyltransferase family 2 protein [Sporomusaceae bacterium]
MNKEISLVMATVGRLEEPELFIQSLLKSQFDLATVELIIVDQNETDALQERLIPYHERLTIQYIRLATRGLSLARNQGLALCSGRIVGFPDDDCEYDPQTLRNVVAAFAQYDKASAIIGAVKTADGAASIRQWPTEPIQLHTMNFYTKFSSVGLFVKREVNSEQFFCEQLGAGAHFGAAEDADYIYQMLKAQKAVFFVPSITVYHPPGAPDAAAKAFSYGLGFGGFCRKNWSLPIFGLFTAALCYHSLRFLQALVSGDSVKRTYSRLCITSRWIGLWTWRRR